MCVRKSVIMREAESEATKLLSVMWIRSAWGTHLAFIL